MKNLSQMLKQAQEMQSKMAEMQTALADLEVTGQSGGGFVAVTVNGKGDVKRVKIDPKLAERTGGPLGDERQRTHRAAAADQRHDQPGAQAQTAEESDLVTVRVHGLEP